MSSGSVRNWIFQTSLDMWFITLDSGSSGPVSSPGRGHCVVFLGKTLYSHGAPLHPGVQRLSFYFSSAL